MPTKAAGWYHQTPTQDGPPLLRYWDGWQWTARTMPAPVEPSPDPSTDASPEPGTGSGTGSGTAEAFVDLQPRAYERPTPAATFDGEPLAGWGLRLRAFLLDDVVVGLTTAVLGARLLRNAVDIYLAYLDRAVDRARVGTPNDPLELPRQLAGTFFWLGLIYVAVTLTYQIATLSTAGATLGMRTMGIRVRRLDRTGPLGLGVVLARAGTQFGPGVIGAIPFVGGVVSLWYLLDGLWPLWDPRRQALHDKVAGTVVVTTG